MPQVLNESKGTVVAENLERADSIWSKFWGLMLRRSLPQHQALLLRPCTSVHMFFMRFPIDVVFIDRQNCVVRVVHNLKPWRAALGGRGAHSALELNAGEAAAAGVEVGDRLVL